MPRRSAALLALVLLLGQPAVAADSAQTDPRSLAEEGLGKLMQALRLLLAQIPQFEAPEMTDGGDIIIRRKREEPVPKGPAEPGTGPGGSI